MQIHGTTHVHGSHGINAPHSAYRGQDAQSTSAARATDQVDISPAAQAALQVADGNGIRTDLVNQIRNQIAAGTYDTPDKMDAALERMLDEMV